MKSLFFIIVLGLVATAICQNPTTEADFATRCLAAHNIEREALGIADLTWSDDLAAAAAEYAQSLDRRSHSRHSYNRHQDGENTAQLRSNPNSLAIMLQEWASEKSAYVHMPYPRCSRTGDAGDVSHYTQMIWQDTTEVGCGFASNNRHDYLVCYYQVPGNQRGQYVYDRNTVGQPVVAAQALANQTTAASQTNTTNQTKPANQTNIVNQTTIINQTTIASTPVVQTPVVQTPVVQAPVVQTPPKSSSSQSSTGSASSSADSFIQQCLDTHNAERAKLGIPNLVWAPELVGPATSWANTLAAKNSLSHSPNRVHIGENVAYTGSKPTSLARNLQMWMDEKQYFKYGAYPDVSTSGDSGDVGHYTQVIWKDTVSVACATATDHGHDFLVCQYKPSGNRMNKYPY